MLTVGGFRTCTPAFFSHYKGVNSSYTFDGTAFNIRLGGKVADLAEGLTLKAHAGWRFALGGGESSPSARLNLNWRF